MYCGLPCGSPQYSKNQYYQNGDSMKSKSKLVGILRPVLIIGILASLLLLASCVYKPVVPAEKDEIIANISGDKNADYDYNYVTSYLRVWRLPAFDSDKFKWAELVFQNYYNLDTGMPEVLKHAQDTATSFMETYYDNIDLSDKESVTNALIDCYVTAVGDPYSIYRTPELYDDYNTDMSGKFGGIGVVVEYDHTNETIMIASVYKDSPAEAAGIKVGDFVYAVEDKTVAEIGYLNVVYLIRGKIGTDVKITVKRGEQLIDTVATRAEVVEKTIEYEITEDGYGYIAVTGFKENTDEQFAEALAYMKYEGVKGIVFDLRNNPGGYVNTVCFMVSCLVPGGTRIISYQYKGMSEQIIVSPSVDNIPVWTDEGPLLDEYGNVVYEQYDMTMWVPVTVICNEYTASSAEIFVSAVRDFADNGLMISESVGQLTFGKGIMQSTFPYRKNGTEDGSAITLTVAYYNPPCGENYHLAGIDPDHEVENTETEDLQYNKAFEVLENLVNANND